MVEPATTEERGRGPRSITIVGRIDVQKPLSPDEMDFFENAWDSMVELFTVNTPAGKIRLLGREHKVATLVQVRAFKANTGLTFEGIDTVNGFGLDIPFPEDVFVADADIRWQYTTVPGTHVPGSRYTGNWIGVAARDTAPGWGANSILLKDANNDPWSLLLFGIMDLIPGSGIVEGAVISMNNRARPLIPLQPWMMLSDVSFRDFKKAFHIDPITAFQVDLNIKYGTATTIAPFPVATVCKTARRALQRGVALSGTTRPVPA